MAGGDHARSEAQGSGGERTFAAAPRSGALPREAAGPETAPEAAAARRIPARLDLRRVAAAVIGGLVLYVALAAFVESRVHAQGNRNPFFKVSTATVREPHLLVLGASRALPLVYDDMNEVVAGRLGAPVMNLAMQGSGVVPNRLLADYFLREHGADNVLGVVYVLDSFAFDSPEWNEQRLVDVAIWQRAPLDPELAATLWTATREMRVPASVFWNYVTGFSKLNDPAGWNEPDVWPDEAKFDATYFPNSLQEQARIAYLYPRGAPSIRPEYEEQFRSLASELTGRGIPLVVVSPPLRDAFLEAVPGEAEFKARLRALLDELGVPYFDFSSGGYTDEHFLDPDHLNRAGALRFLERDLVPMLAELGWR